MKNMIHLKLNFQFISIIILINIRWSFPFFIQSEDFYYKDKRLVIISGVSGKCSLFGREVTSACWSGFGGRSSDPRHLCIFWHIYGSPITPQWDTSKRHLKPTNHQKIKYEFHNKEAMVCFKAPTDGRESQYAVSIYVLLGTLANF